MAELHASPSSACRHLPHRERGEALRRAPVPSRWRHGTMQPDRCRHPHPLGQQHRGDLRSRHPGAEGRVAVGAEGRHHGAARRQRRRQDDDAEGHLQPASRRARRGDQGHHRLRRRRGAVAVAQRSGAARLHPGDGGPPLLRPPLGRGQSDDGRVHAARRQGRDQGRPRPRLPVFPAAEAAPHEPGRLHLRRRAADDGDRPRADVAGRR